MKDSRDELRAMCLNEDSPEYREYMADYDDCPMQEIGIPIDE